MASQAQATIGTTTSDGGARPAGLLRRLSLPWRVFLGNSLVLGAAIVLLAATPARVRVPSGLEEAVVLVGGITAILVTNIMILRRAFAPLDRLTGAMGRFEPLEPGTRIPVYGDDQAVVELTRAFNEMLDRLEAERRDSVHRSLAAQESERRRVAQELHDEVGQTLTAIVLQLDRLARVANGDFRAALEDTRESARESLGDVRRIAQRLRPETLEDLGLTPALEALCDRVSEQAGLHVRQRLEPEVGELDADLELVVYRVAQEALTNVLRHSQATQVDIELSRRDGGLALRVADNGVGIEPRAKRGGGLQGMRERALMVGGRVSVRELGRGTEVLLLVPDWRGAP